MISLRWSTLRRVLMVRSARPGVLAHGKVLADGQQIGKVRRRVERVARVLQRIGLQQVDLGIFHDQGTAVFRLLR